MNLFSMLQSPSTRAFFDEGRRSNRTLLDMVHGYVYLRWPYLYIAVARGDHWLSRLFWPLEPWIARYAAKNFGLAPDGRADAPLTWGDTYHGKVIPLEDATSLIRVDRDIQVECPEKVIPYPIARDIVLKNPDHIVVLDCPCRASRPHPCTPVDVCLIVGDPFASFAEEHHPGRARRISPDEAATILREEDERGHVHHAFFKDAVLGRFYAICNCCSCCCGAMQAHQHGSTMLASSGYIARVDDDACQACGDCNPFCQFDALRTHGLSTSVDEGRCMGCGICVSKCVYGAISLERAPSRGEPLKIEQLLENAKKPLVPVEG